MALAKRDAIDEKLTEMYFDKVTVNLETTNRIAPEDFWNQMQMLACTYKATINYQVKR